MCIYIDIYFDSLWVWDGGLFGFVGCFGFEVDILMVYLFFFLRNDTHFAPFSFFSFFFCFLLSSIPGVRIIKQDPWECLISFICSSNNNIPRITSMLQSIRQTYGQPIIDNRTNGFPNHHNNHNHNNNNTSFDSHHDNNNPQNNNNSCWYTFPSPQELSLATEVDLRTKCGLGYRAKYIIQTTKQVLEWGGESALWKLRRRSQQEQEQQHPHNHDDDNNNEHTDNTDNNGDHQLFGITTTTTTSDEEMYDSVRNQLMQLSGVGPKVADCVALFSLSQETCAIPVDVHVWNICVRDYAASTTRNYRPPEDDDDKKDNKDNDNNVQEDKNDKDVVLLLGSGPKKSSSSLTPKRYKHIQDIFRRQFPTKTGWAHSLLFVAELPSFRPALPQSILDEMDEVRTSVFCCCCCLFLDVRQQQQQQATALKYSTIGLSFHIYIYILMDGFVVVVGVLAVCFLFFIFSFRISHPPLSPTIFALAHTACV